MMPVRAERHRDREPGRTFDLRPTLDLPYGPTDLCRALYGALVDAMLAEGMTGIVASRIALRCVRQFFLAAELGHSQREAAAAVGKCERQAKYDLARLRRVIREGWLDGAAAGALEPIPRDPADRIAEPARVAA